MVNNIFNFYFACAISLIFLIIFFFLALMVVFKPILNILFTYFASARFRSLISGAIWIQCVSGCLRMCDWYVRISRFIRGTIKLPGYLSKCFYLLHRSSIMATASYRHRHNGNCKLPLQIMCRNRWFSIIYWIYEIANIYITIMCKVQKYYS